MNRSRIVIALVACLAAGSAQVLRADVRSEEKTKFQLAGALGKVVNFFGGKSAREGVTSTVAVKGNRKMTTTGQTGQIVDLSEEKIYDLDIKKKSYKVTTFAEVRRQMEEARRKAEEEAKKAEAEERKEETKDEPPAERDPNAKEYEVDFDIKNTGEKKTVNGFDTQQSVMTITVREKGKTLEQAGGLVMTTDMWLTPAIAAMKEVQDFDLKYYEKLYGPMVAGASPQDMAAAMAMYPMIKPAMDKMAAEGSKLEGTAVLTVMTVDAVKSAEQVAAEAKGSTETASSGGGSAPPASVGGLIGGFGRRMAQRRQQNQEPAAAAKDRANIMTTTHEVLKVATSVADGDVSVPAGFKEEK